MKRVYLLGCVLILAAPLLAQQDQPSTAPAAPTAASQDAATPAPPPQPPQQVTATAETPAPPTAPAVARLHVYRQHRYIGSALSPSITVDGKKVARVGSGRRVIIKLTPGSHTIGSDDKSSAITLDVKAGQDYFIRVDEEAGFWKGHGRLTMVMPEQGSAEFKLQKLIEPDRKVAKDMIEDEVEAPPDKSR